MNKLCKLAALLLAVVLMATGCAASPAQYGSTAAATYGSETVYMDEANFWTRYYQYSYESYYGYLYQYYYGYNNMWVLESGNRGSQTFADTLKESVMAQQLQGFILRAHAEEYKVSITDEDKAKIADFIAELHEHMPEAFWTLVGDVSDERLTEILTGSSLAVKVWDAVKAAAEVSVDTDACKSFTVSYFLVSETKEEDHDHSTEGESSEKEIINEDLAKLIETAWKNGSDFDDLKEDYSEGTSSSTVSYLIEGEDETTAATELYKNGKEMKEGEIKTVYKEGTGWYVIRCDSEDDPDAQALEAANREETAREEAFNEVYKGWAAGAGSISVKKAYKDLEITAAFLES